LRSASTLRPRRTSTTFSFGTMISSNRCDELRCLACSRIDSATLFSKFE
jgi:hypothetical protein